MIRQLISKLLRKPSAPPASGQIEVRIDEVLEVHLSRLPEAFRSSAAGGVVECLTPYVDGKTMTSIRRAQ